MEIIKFHDSVHFLRKSRASNHRNTKDKFNTREETKFYAKSLKNILLQGRLKFLLQASLSAS